MSTYRLESTEYYATILHNNNVILTVWRLHSIKQRQWDATVLQMSRLTACASVGALALTRHPNPNRDT
jgi:hypothetical protein